MNILIACLSLAGGAFVGWTIGAIRSINELNRTIVPLIKELTKAETMHASLTLDRAKRLERVIEILVAKKIIAYEDDKPVTH